MATMKTHRTWHWDIGKVEGVRGWLHTNTSHQPPKHLKAKSSLSAAPKRRRNGFCEALLLHREHFGLRFADGERELLREGCGSRGGKVGEPGMSGNDVFF